MLKVSRPHTGTLIISQGRAQALVRLLIWAGVVVLFYIVMISDLVQIGERPEGGEAAAWHLWALMLFPLFLLPYLFGLLRTIRRADDLIFDGREKTVSKGKQTLAAYADIRALELLSVHATCEEFRLSAVLADGVSIELMETEASVAIEVLAREISDLLNVPLDRKA